MDLSDRSIMLKGVGQRLVRSAKVSLRSDAPEDADGAAPGAEDTLLSSMYVCMYEYTIKTIALCNGNCIYACTDIRTCVFGRFLIIGWGRATLAAHTETQNSLENIFCFIGQEPYLRVRVQPIYSGRLRWERFCNQIRVHS